MTYLSNNEQQLLTFKKLSDEGQLQALVELFESKDILFEVEKYGTTYDAAIGGITRDLEYHIKILPSDFTKAQNLLSEQAKEDIANVDRTYYLFDFSDEELLDILLKRDEWSAFDYALGEKILKERGKEFTPATLELMRNRRIEELAKPEPSYKTWIFAGYLFACLGGIIGALIGWHLMSFKKTLPNGKRVYGHNESDRKHGQIIFIIGSIMLVVVTILKISMELVDL